jgi:hypothetical protein
VNNDVIGAASDKCDSIPKQRDKGQQDTKCKQNTKGQQDITVQQDTKCQQETHDENQNNGSQNP